MLSAIVVGAGIFGSSLSYRLVRAGWKVTIVDKYPPGHVRAASGDESRLIRFSHATEDWYTRSAWRGVDLWRELEQESGRKLFEQCGLAWFARTDAGWEADSERVLRAEGIPVERLDPEEGRKLFPSFRDWGLAFILFEPEAGVLRAREAVQTIVRQAQAEGAELVLGDARPAGSVVEVNGERLEADCVVWACGAWLAGLFPGLVQLEVTKQDVLYFGGGPEWQTPPVPAWVEYDRAFYGHGDLDGRGVKVAPDREGPPIDPDRDSRLTAAVSEFEARDFMKTRFPSLADAPLVGGRACPYALTKDTNFLAAPHPEYEGVWILGGGSGHGFKHGPALAEYVTGLLDGRDEPDPRFSLGPRNPGRSLRTAGTR